jgi:hypothetical protein
MKLGFHVVFERQARQRDGSADGFPASLALVVVLAPGFAGFLALGSDAESVVFKAELISFFLKPAAWLAR